MTPLQQKNTAKLAIAGGSIRLFSQLFYWFYTHILHHIVGNPYNPKDISNVWFGGNSAAHVFFWLVVNAFYSKEPKYKAYFEFFLILSVNDFIDEWGSPVLTILMGKPIIFTDPTDVGWNEWVFAALVIYWYARKMYKCRKSKNG